MLRDLFIREPESPKFQNREVEVTSREDIIIQKVLVLLHTNKGEFIGDPDFGCGIEEYLFETNPSAAAIQSEIERQISMYIAEDSREFTITPTVWISRDEQGYPVGIVDIKINGMSKYETKFNR